MSWSIMLASGGGTGSVFGAAGFAGAGWGCGGAGALSFFGPGDDGVGVTGLVAADVAPGAGAAGTCGALFAGAWATVPPGGMVEGFCWFAMLLLFISSRACKSFTCFSSLATRLSD